MTGEPLALCQPPRPLANKPRLVCPPGTTDTHVHVYGPNDRYPPSPTRFFDVPEATPAMLSDLFDVLGVDRVVFIQPSGYGLDNRRHLNAMREIGRPARAVASLRADVPDAELERLHAAGFRGVRYAIGHSSGAPIDEMPRMSARIAELGWHVQVHVFSAQGSPLTDYEPVIAGLACDVVLDHVASIEPSAGQEQPGFVSLQRLAETGHCWIKLSGGYRVSATSPYLDMVPFVHRLVSLRADRLIWGSDWPHVNFKGTMPNTTELLDQMAIWVPDEAVRNQILVDNPAKLYGFDPLVS